MSGPGPTRAARLRARAWPPARGAARRLGYHLVPATFYAPIPERDVAIPGTPAEMPGLALDLDAQLDFLTHELGPYLREPMAISPENPFYGPLDAETLHAMARAHRPGRVVELGSGQTTQILRAAGLSVDSYDPFGTLPGVHPTATEALPLDVFTSLGPGDWLFADTTHAARVGGDVVRLLLDVLPRLAPGVLVHLHDIFRPYDYPRELLEQGAYWQEHWLLQALLVENPHWEVVLANHALHRTHPESVKALVPSLRDGVHPSAWWMRRR